MTAEAAGEMLLDKPARATRALKAIASE
jgi:hypothetical protein